MFEPFLKRSALWALLVAGPALAQKSDFNILVGAYVRTAGASTRPIRVSSSVGAGVMLTYGHHLASTRAGDLLLDVPLSASARVSGTLSRRVFAGSGGNVFFTPGVSLLIAPASPIRPYAVLGGGVGCFSGSQVSVTRDVEVRIGRFTSPVVGFGGGLDVRLARFLSLRGEIRDFVSRAEMGGAEGRHHVMFGVGLGFHFR